MKPTADPKTGASATNRSQPKSVYIKTFGCQMNDYDSAKMLEQLRGENYLPVESPRDADLILVNTCASGKNPSTRSTACWAPWGRSNALGLTL